MGAKGRVRWHVSCLVLQWGAARGHVDVSCGWQWDSGGRLSCRLQWGAGHVSCVVLQWDAARGHVRCRLGARGHVKQKAW